MSKHTPGPWVSFTTEQGGPGVSIDDTSDFWLPILEESGQEGWVICRLTKWDRCDKDPEVVAANMALIAAAPDMLAALEALVKWGERPVSNHPAAKHYCDSGVWNAAIDAIEKAKAGGAK